MDTIGVLVILPIPSAPLARFQFSPAPRTSETSPSWKKTSLVPAWGVPARGVDANELWAELSTVDCWREGDAKAKSGTTSGTTGVGGAACFAWEVRAGDGGAGALGCGDGSGVGEARLARGRSAMGERDLGLFCG